MKKILITCLTIISIGKLIAQTSVVTLGNFTREVPKVGHMLNYLTKPSWRNQSFIDSVKTLNIEIIRYPGGTESQYFDWQTGRSLPSSLWTNGSLFNHSYIGTVPHVSYPLTELLYFYQQTNIKPIFCLNMITKSLSNQIQMLQSASNLGIPVEYIELGNELYFEDIDFTNKYPNPIDYVRDIKNNWIPQLKALFPNAKIAIIGAYDGTIDLNGNTIPARINTWNNTIFTENVQSNAITFHYYLPPNTTTLSNPNIIQALAAPFKHWPVLKKNTVDNVKNGMECWITEYNLNDGNQTTYAFASSWTHGLFTASLFSLMLEETKITMLLNHQITGSASYASLASYTTFGDTLTNRMTSEGNAMRLIHKAIKGKNIATKLNFSVNPSITVGSTVYPSLMGWVFEKNEETELFILNLTAREFELDFKAIFDNTYSFEQISSNDPLQKNITTQDLTINKGISSNTIRLLPYSLLSASKYTTVTAVDDYNSIDEITVYPNPSDDHLLISSSKATINDNPFKVIDMLGKTIIQGKLKSNYINISQLPSGTYNLYLELDHSKYLFHKIIKK